MTTIFFLDMDGPMQSLRSALVGLEYDPVGVAAVNKCIRQKGVQCVIASTVRILCEDTDDARNRLAKYGLVNMTFHERWRTGGSLVHRSDEIHQWIKDYGQPDYKYVAVDDDPVDIEGVLHVKANRNGISHHQMMHMLHSVGLCDQKTIDSWNEWYEDRARIEAARSSKDPKYNHTPHKKPKEWL